VRTLKTLYPWNQAVRLIAAAFLALSPAILSAQADSAITVTVHTPKEQAQAKVTRAMIAEGLAISDATSGGLIVGTGTENHNTVDVRYTAVILPADS
jgi:hypothetical protein